jgi:hypothetical protein
VPHRIFAFYQAAQSSSCGVCVARERLRQPQPYHRRLTMSASTIRLLVETPNATNMLSVSELHEYIFRTCSGLMSQLLEAFQ